MKPFRWIVLTLLLVLALMLAACGGGEEPSPAEAPEQPAATEAAAEPTPTPPPPTPTPEPPTPTPEPEADDEELTLTAEQLATLEDLDSYRSYTLLTYQGTDEGGQALDVSMEIRSEYTKDPEARAFAMTGTGVTPDAPADQVETIEFYQVGDAMYAQFEGQWVQLSASESPLSDPDAQFLTNTGVLFSDLEGLRRVRPDEEINGVDSQHYEFDERNLDTMLDPSVDEDVEVSGEVWIAKDGGFVTRYVMDAEIKQSGSLMAPELAQGTLRMEFELSDVNQDFVIDLPTEATGSLSLPGFEEGDFPVPDGASVTLASSEGTMMETELTPEEIQAFYEEALGELGWTADEEESAIFGDFGNLIFTKDDLTLSITILGGEGPTQIIAAVESAP